MEEITLEFLRKIEEKWQQIWKEKEVYEAEPDPNKRKFFITVPYPYTSGPLHIGHGRTYVTGDVIARFKRLLGFNVLFPMAFHVTGMPILSISDRIRRGDKKILERYRNYIGYYVRDPDKIEEILESFRDPINVALFFANNIQRDFESIGLGIDWRRKFHTAEPIYNRFVEWQYYRLRDLGLVRKGTYYVRYCLLHRQPVGEDDIEDGDVNPVHIQEFVVIKFEYEDGYILASTLRPETLYGATNMWVNPDATYIKVRVDGGEIWYLSKEGLVKLEHQYPSKFEVLEEIPGHLFVGKYTISPLGDKLIILPAFFVDPDRATGFVYSEPADAPYDYVALLDLKRDPSILRRYNLDPSVLEGITPKKIINIPGISGLHTEYVVKKYGIKNQMDPKLIDATEEVYKEQFYKGVMNENAGELKGLPVKEARERIKEKLLRENRAIIFYETSRKAVCRGKGKIIVARVDDQWFIDYSQDWWKEKSKDHLSKMLIVPNKYRKLFEDTIDWLKFRPCARLRGLGTHLPYDKKWVIESLSDSTIYMAFYTVAHIIRKYNIAAEQLIPEVFDYVFLGRGDPSEISKLTKIPVEILKEMRESFEYWYPNDLRHTATPHITNHLTFFIMHHVALFPQKYWPCGISLNGLVLREGQKMAKSKGNVIPLADIAKKYSADLFRLYIASSADLDGTVDWREAEVSQLKRSLLSFVKICLKVAEIKEKVSVESIPINARWFLSRFYRRLEDAKNSMENFRIRDYVVSLFYETMNDINKLRKRIGEDQTLRVIRYILRDWIIALSPIIPHIAEEIWSRINDDRTIWSINYARWPTPKTDLIDEKLETLEELLDSLISLGHELKRIIGKPIHSATVVVAAKWKFYVLEVVRRMILEEEVRDVRKIIDEIKKNPDLKQHIKEATGLVIKAVQGKIRIPRVPLSQSIIFDYIRANSDYIAKELGVASLSITLEEEAPPEIRDRAKRALPDRLLIVFK